MTRTGWFVVWMLLYWPISTVVEFIETYILIHLRGRPPLSDGVVAIASFVELVFWLCIGSLLWRGRNG